MRPDTNPRDYLVAESPAMRAVVATIERLADSDGPALVCGEHGTGRELVARVLHAQSPRRGGRFVTARPTFEAPGGDGDDGERARRMMRAAQGGTLLVKDVCDVAASGQRQLYEPMSARRIDVPPLRDRGGDIPTLVERWVRRYADEIGRGKLTISTRAHERLVKYPWPGNVAELKHLCRRLVVNTSASRIEAGDVDAVLPVVAERVPLEDLSFEDMVKAKLGGFLQRMDGYPLHDLYDKILERVERPLFDLVLEKTGGNQLKAAEILGLNRNTLRKKLDALGVARRGKGREDRALDD